MRLFKKRDPSVGTFVLGLGAQKAGTSWLFSYFRTVPEIHTGFMKEYHVLDSLHVYKMRGTQKTLADRTIQALKKGNYQTSPCPWMLKRMAMLADTEFYYDYFEHLLLKHGGLTCDMTPSHMALPTTAMQIVKDNFATRNIRVRPLLLMRDPVERCWSAMRMDRRNGRLEQYDDTYSESAMLSEEFKTEKQRLRSNYAAAIKRIEQAFDETEVIYGFYETMFTNEFIQQLADSLGFDFVEPNFDVHHNVSPKTDPLDDEVQREIVQFFKGNYRFMARKFGDEFMRGIWPSYRFLD
ncbi:sulfotransferase domain-containing protein [Roseovarius indicus]|uniref:sulfotransferase domain-containing protein n=1 Tax=Roseovarius indicus TaxID=540747 RepID=UPI0007D96A1E|nr:sulfotransferase domain-containing protein [Roseovarius indicus]OAN99952.1 hypothetical protein A8B76_21510 [Roseovarius indicus]